MKVCHFCGREIQVGSRADRSASCPHCRADLRCCRNCRFHDPGYNNQCQEPQAEWVSEKDKADFCEFFQFREAAGGAAPAARDSARARSAFDALFGDD